MLRSHRSRLKSQTSKLLDGSRASALILGLLSGPRGGPSYNTTAAMAPRTSEPSAGEEEEQYATPSRTQERGGRRRSRGRSPTPRSPTPRPLPESTSSDSAQTPVGIPGEPQESGESPQTVESSTSLGSTPLDREQADEPAAPTQRQFIPCESSHSHPC